MNILKYITIYQDSGLSITPPISGYIHCINCQWNGIEYDYGKQPIIKGATFYCLAQLQPKPGEMTNTQKPYIPKTCKQGRHDEQTDYCTDKYHYCFRCSQKEKWWNYICWHKQNHPDLPGFWQGENPLVKSNHCFEHDLSPDYFFLFDIVLG